MKILRAIFLFIAPVAAATLLCATSYAQAVSCPNNPYTPEFVLINGGAIALPDQDADGVPDEDQFGNPKDNCPCIPNGNCDEDAVHCDVNLDTNADASERGVGYQTDSDADGLGDACEDRDADAIWDWRDNCEEVPNSDCTLNGAYCDVNGDQTLTRAEADVGSQLDSDSDGVGDACEDSDGDGIYNVIDNCASRYNPEQEDGDRDGFGDWCDICRSVTDPNQDSALCLAEAAESLPPRFPPPNPNTGIDYDMGPDLERGGGGCQMAGSAAVNPFGLIVLLSSIVITAYRRRI